MNMIQMKYFITAAKCLNFTKAADKLFITQPALSRQIASMEAELNMQLFIRNNRSVRLTPAAVVLLEGFEKIYNEYNVTVAKALNSFQGLSGELNIGILDGTYVGDLFPGVLKHFANCYPNVKINLQNYSFNALVENLYSSRLDLIITLRFDVEHREKMKYRVIEETRDHVVVHKDHRLANASYVKLSDFKDDTFIMVSPEDSEESPKLIIDACKMSGFNPHVKFASSVQEEMLWVQAGALNVEALEFLPEVRQMCAADRCRSFNRNWSCPPGCGTLEEIAERVKPYTRGILVQSIGQLEDEFDVETMMETEHTQKARFAQLVEYVRSKEPDCIPMAAGTCQVCEKCTYPDAPCRFPEKSIPSMEAYGLFVSKVCIQSGMKYNYGKNTIAYSSCILLK